MREETRMGQADDGQLACWARDGCRAAFDELARRYRPGVFLIARQVAREASRAEDVAQEALLIAFHALPTLEDEDEDRFDELGVACILLNAYLDEDDALPLVPPAPPNMVVVHSGSDSEELRDLLRERMPAQ